MGLIVDTSVFIAWERSGRAINFEAWSSYGEVAISAITASELLVGVWRANSEQRRLWRSAFVEAILSQVPVLDITTDVARRHAELFAEMIAREKQSELMTC